MVAEHAFWIDIARILALRQNLINGISSGALISSSSFNFNNDCIKITTFFKRANIILDFMYVGSIRFGKVMFVDHNIENWNIDTSYHRRVCSNPNCTMAERYSKLLNDMLPCISPTLNWEYPSWIQLPTEFNLDDTVESINLFGSTVSQASDNASENVSDNTSDNANENASNNTSDNTIISNSVVIDNLYTMLNRYTHIQAQVQSTIESLNIKSLYTVDSDKVINAIKFTILRNNVVRNSYCIPELVKYIPAIKYIITSIRNMDITVLVKSCELVYINEQCTIMKEISLIYPPDIFEQLTKICSNDALCELLYAETCTKTGIKASANQNFLYWF